jgi:hypothetical protein
MQLPHRLRDRRDTRHDHGTALGWSQRRHDRRLGPALAFFAYSLTSLPLLRAGLGPRRVTPPAIGSDSLSITMMEIVETLSLRPCPARARLRAIPSSREDGLGNRVV